jgi:hypothetical protein
LDTLIELPPQELQVGVTQGFAAIRITDLPPPHRPRARLDIAMMLNRLRLITR